LERVRVAVIASAARATKRRASKAHKGSRLSHNREELDDDLISHSSLRRELDDTFLNQPLRGQHLARVVGPDLETTLDRRWRREEGNQRGVPQVRCRTHKGSSSHVSTMASARRRTKGARVTSKRREKLAGGRTTPRQATGGSSAEGHCGAGAAGGALGQEGSSGGRAGRTRGPHSPATRSSTRTPLSSAGTGTESMSWGRLSRKASRGQGRRVGQQTPRRE
ncbi:unnamed protein product, partial [Discosporangium mesarthrocarpum]